MFSTSPASQKPAQDSVASAAFNYKGWREKFILVILRISCVAGIALIASSYSTATLNDRILFIGLYLILLAVSILPATYNIRAYTLLVMIFAVGVNAILAVGPWVDGSLFLLIFVVLSALLFDNRMELLALIASIAILTSIAVLQQLGSFEFTNKSAPITTIADWAIYGADFLGVSITLIVAIRLFKNEFAKVIQQTQSTLTTLISERAQLELRVQERTEEIEARATQLRSSTTVARTVAEIQSIGELIEAATKLTSEQFSYYHVGLYLLDEGKRNAFLQSASSTVGKNLIGQGFRIEPDRRNAVHLVVEQNRSYIASDIGDANFIREPNFPLTRSRMMLPLTVRGEVIGVLDLHSEQPQAFTPQDAEIMQTLADLIAISIDNVRLIDETKALINQLESNTSIQTKQTWTKLTSRHTPAYQYTPAGVRPIFSSNKKESNNGLKIPLVLHGQKIGAINLLRKGSSASWSERERSLIEKIADQVSLALENSRLVDEAQKSALRDQMIANISSRVRETLDVESVVRTAATELRRVFDLKEAEISIGSIQAAPPPPKKHTSQLKLK